LLFKIEFVNHWFKHLPMTSSLSDSVKELIAKSRIVSFAEWSVQYTPATIALFQSADDEGRFLTHADLNELCQVAPDPQLTSIANTLRDLAPDIVDEARLQVLKTFPDITEPGGGLYPALRAEACWRDFWHFLRCISYGVAGQRTDFTSAKGLHYMQLLYQELNVPLPAMIVGLNALQTASLSRVAANQQDAIVPYFQHLVTQLSYFEVKP
jgi:Phycobilisome protein